MTHPKTEEDIILFRLSGEMTKGSRITSLIEDVQEYLRSGYRTLVFDFQNVFYINSGGIDEIFRIFRAIRSYDGALVFIRIQPSVQEVFHLTPEFKDIPLYSSLEEYFNTVQS